MTRVAQAIRHAHRLGYRVSPLGLVITPSGTVRQTPMTGLGRTLYKRFTIWFKGRSVSIPVHRFCGFQLFGERALRKGVMVRHRDNDSFNNKLDNFLLGNNGQNMRDIHPDHLSRIAQSGNRIKKARRHAHH